MPPVRPSPERRQVRRNRIFVFLATLVVCSSLGSLAIAAEYDGERRAAMSAAATATTKERATRITTSRRADADKPASRSQSVPESASTPSPESTPEPPAPAPEPDPAPPAPPVDCAAVACVALTFDDGPGPDTGRLLDILAAKGVHATFFVLGGAAGARPELVAREINEGHAVGNHTWDHKDLTKLADGDIDWEVGQSRDTIAAASGFVPTMVRPPYGAVDDRVAGRIGALGDSMILWNVDSQDWRNKDTAATTQQVLDTVKPGAIVLLHDIHSWTVDAVPGIIDELHARGYTLVTVPELLGGTPAPGTKHFSR